MINKKLITRDDILATVSIQDTSERQHRINDIVIAFANKTVQFESSDSWSEYYELIHTKTNLSHELKKKAFFNAYDSQMRNNGR